MRFLFIIGILLWLPAHLSAQAHSVQVLKQANRALLKKQYFSYQGVGKFKFFNHDESISFSGSVYLKREEKDTVFHAQLAFHTNDSIYKFYNRHNSYVVNKKKKTATIYNPASVGTWPLSGNVYYRIVGKYFLHPDELLKETDSANVIVPLNDTVIDGKICYHISVQHPDDNEFTDNVTQWFISQKDYTVVGMANRVQFQGNYQYYDLFLSTYSYNAIPITKFAASQIPKDYATIKYDDKQSQKKVTLLDTNSIAPEIEGVNYSNGMSHDTLSFMDAVTILDFWYMECIPCINTIKVLERLKEKYEGNNLQIVGVNSINNNAKDMSKLPKFLSNNVIKYPLLLVDKKVTDRYKVTAWPTIYIIDGNNFVRYAAEGFSSTLENELDSVIQKLYIK